jgi:hypothetical protein
MAQSHIIFKPDLCLVTFRDQSRPVRPTPFKTARMGGRARICPMQGLVKRKATKLKESKKIAEL